MSESASDMVSDAARESVAALIARCESIPTELRRYLNEVVAPAIAFGSTLVTTGIGASEAPARLLARAWQTTGRHAWFVPLSQFAVAPPLPSDATLVVFSQGLSPNARLAFRDPAQLTRTLLVTSLADDHADAALLHLLVERGLHVLRIPPHEESGSLVRLVGPAVAMLAAFHLATHDTRALAALPAAVERAFANGLILAEKLGPERILDGTIALVTVGDAGERAHGLRWKFLEALGHCDPAVWDILQVAHGPLQHFYERPLTLLVLAHGEEDDELIARLRTLCRSDRHRVVPLVATLPAPLSVFEHDALGNALVAAALRARPRDLGVWPAQGLDGALYELGR